MRHLLGFTLVELAVMVLILGLLLGFAAPAFKRYMERAPELEAKRLDGYEEVRFEMVTGRRCPRTKRHAQGISAEYLVLCPPIPED